MRVLATCTNNELADAVQSINYPVGVLWHESLIVVIVSIDNHIRTAVIENFPERFNLSLPKIRSY